MGVRKKYRRNKLPHPLSTVTRGSDQPPFSLAITWITFHIRYKFHAGSEQTLERPCAARLHPAWPTGPSIPHPVLCSLAQLRTLLQMRREGHNFHIPARAAASSRSKEARVYSTARPAAYSWELRATRRFRLFVDPSAAAFHPRCYCLTLRGDCSCRSRLYHFRTGYSRSFSAVGDRPSAGSPPSSVCVPWKMPIAIHGRREKLNAASAVHCAPRSTVRQVAPKGSRGGSLKWQGREDVGQRKSSSSPSFCLLF